MEPSDVVRTGFESSWKPTSAEAKAALPVIQAYLERSKDADHVLHVLGQDKQDIRVWYAGRILKILADKQGYRVQFVGTSNRFQRIPDLPENRKLIYCNFIPLAHRVETKADIFDNWRHQFVMLNGGGYQYWHVLYDPTTNSVVDFDCNDDAFNQPKRMTSQARLLTISSQ